MLFELLPRIYCSVMKIFGGNKGNRTNLRLPPVCNWHIHTRTYVLALCDVNRSAETMHARSEL